MRLAPPAVAGSGEASEGLLNKLLAPGPLIEGHKSFEATQCLTCHVVRHGVPDAKCLACHHEIDSELKRGKGFHALAHAGADAKACIACHSDHKGRDFDSTRIDAKSFDHKATGFPLEGKHAEAKCEKCHERTRAEALETRPVPGGLARAMAGELPRPHDPSFLGLKPACASCHAKDDVHFFKGEWARRDCGECHQGSESWTKGARFEHEKQAHYKLDGRHAELKCEKCHVPEETKARKVSVYHWPGLKKNDCLECHASPHVGKMKAELQKGTACVKCHTTETWKTAEFDHSVTGYALLGKHEGADCVKCHAQTSATHGLKLSAFQFKGLKQDCNSCHKDPHQFGLLRTARLGPLTDCAKCHHETSWGDTPRFEHNRDTRFAIGGKHLQVKCSQCHTLDPKSPPATPVRIYHWTQFPKKNCVLCHASPHTKVFSPALQRKECSECHDDRSWKVQSREKKAFDHTTTRFALTGKHGELACDECHLVKGREAYKFSDADKEFCVACHDNVHAGQFDAHHSQMKCSACHTTTSFTERPPFDHASARLTLTGAHAKLDCVKCHVPTGATFATEPFHARHRYVFKTLATQDCAACHNDPHKGAYGPLCSLCHVDKSWKEGATADFHKNMLLTGAHLHLACAECHTGGFASTGASRSEARRLHGLSQNCLACHLKDDIHQGRLPDCGSCHKQTFWENPDFQHSMTRFPLQGAHRTIECQACHQSGIYRGLNTACASCHRGDALSFGGSPNHQLLLGHDCAECHNVFSFQ